MPELLISYSIGSFHRSKMLGLFYFKRKVTGIIFLAKDSNNKNLQISNYLFSAHS
jgi:hypothetical protein